MRQKWKFEMESRLIAERQWRNTANTEGVALIIVSSDVVTSLIFKFLVVAVVVVITALTCIPPGFDECKHSQ